MSREHRLCMFGWNYVSVFGAVGEDALPNSRHCLAGSTETSYICGTYANVMCTRMPRRTSVCSTCNCSYSFIITSTRTLVRGWRDSACLFYHWYVSTQGIRRSCTFALRTFCFTWAVGSARMPLGTAQRNIACSCADVFCRVCRGHFACKCMSSLALVT